MGRGWRLLRPRPPPRSSALASRRREPREAGSRAPLRATPTPTRPTPSPKQHACRPPLAPPRSRRDRRGPGPPPEPRIGSPRPSTRAVESAGEARRRGVAPLLLSPFRFARFRPRLAAPAGPQRGAGRARYQTAHRPRAPHAARCGRGRTGGAFGGEGVGFVRRGRELTVRSSPLSLLSLCSLCLSLRTMTGPRRRPSTGGADSSLERAQRRSSHRALSAIGGEEGSKKKTRQLCVRVKRGSSNGSNVRGSGGDGG
jgi:hypothetical protein